jgi:hypothetical protein
VCCYGPVDSRSIIIFRQRSHRILADMSIIVADVRNFSRSLQASSGMGHYLREYRFLPSPFQCFNRPARRHEFTTDTVGCVEPTGHGRPTVGPQGTGLEWRLAVESCLTIGWGRLVLTTHSLDSEHSISEHQVKAEVHSPCPGTAGRFSDCFHT